MVAQRYNKQRLKCKEKISQFNFSSFHRGELISIRAVSTLSQKNFSVICI